MAEEQEQYVEEAALVDDADMVGEDYAGDAQVEGIEDAPAEGNGDQQEELPTAPNEAENGDCNGGTTNGEPKADGDEPVPQEQGADAAREQELATAEDEMQRNQQQQEQQGAGDAEDPMSQPPHGTEVFITKIPREASDAQLKAFCEMAGEVYALRVPKDRESNNNKGYCFCVFKHRESADKAMTILEGREVKDFPGRRVNVVPSIVKNKLYIGQMPRDITREELEAILKQEVVGLEKIELMMDKETNQSRGFGFIAFYNNAAATLALEKLSRPDFKLRGQQVQVLWADPKRDEIGMEKVKAIYVGNLPEHYSENELRSIFSQYGTIDRVTLLYMPDDPGKLRNYTFITFTERSAAVRAVSEAESKKHSMGDKDLLVHMAKPQAHRDDGGGMGMGRGYGPGGYGYPPRGYGPPGRGGGRGPGGRGAGRGPPGGGRGYGPPGGGRGYHQGDYGYGGYEEGYDYGYEEGYDEEYDGYGYGYGYGGYPGMPIMPVVVPSGQFGYVMGGATGYHEGGGGAAGAGAGGPVRRSGGAPAGPGPRERSVEGRGEGRPAGEYGAAGGGYGGGGYGGSRGGGGGGAYEDRGYGEKYSQRAEYGVARAGYDAHGGHRDAGGYGGGERYYSSGHQGGRGGGAPARGGYGGGERGGGAYGERGYGERSYGERGYAAERGGGGGGGYGGGHYGGERGGGGHGAERSGAPYGGERGGYGGGGVPPAYSAPPPSRGPPAGGAPAYAASSAGYHGGSGSYAGGSSGGGRPGSYQGGSGSYTGGSGGSRPPAGPGGGGGYGSRGGPPRYAPY